ncbi:MAG: ABC transporter ATP-binding protein [Sandaracinaceae bacterium]|nr:ABC transporter ATP-binding protein [Myxococcales bacterium]MCB9660909.1 ABC transporter ATP-binding protein [Sandaracinaceae bacterium]
MIEVQELTKRYGSTTAVDAISFNVPSGEIVGFLGPNGAGKSTTLRMITGYLAPTSGRVRVGGIDVHDNPREARRLIGYMPEGVPMYRDMRVLEYLRFRAELKEMGRREVSGAVERALAQADVTDAADKVIGRLSKGYRQRVGLADALLTDPPLLILDEPSSGLDPNQNRHVRELLRGFEGHKTVFLSTHILPQVENTCGRVIIIRKGKLMAQGKASELRANPAGTRAVTLGGPASAEAYERALAGVTGVRSVERLGATDGGHAVRLTAVPGDEVLEAVFQAVVAAGLSLHRLVPESASLESVFADLTTTDPAGPTDDATGEAPADEGVDEADGAGGADDEPTDRGADEGDSAS